MQNLNESSTITSFIWSTIKKFIWSTLKKFIWSPRRRRQEEEEVWIPKTSIGTRVLSGEINSMEEILSKGLRIQEAGIVKKLLPDL